MSAFFASRTISSGSLPIPLYSPGESNALAPCFIGLASSPNLGNLAASLIAASQSSRAIIARNISIFFSTSFLHALVDMAYAYSDSVAHNVTVSTYDGAVFWAP